MLLDGGDYVFTVLGNNLTDTVVAGARVISAAEGGFTVLEAPTTPETFTIDATTDGVATTCSATIESSSVNLRTGPGTGYTVMDYAYRNENYPVGGRNPENNWVLIATPDGETAWVSVGTARLEGTCADLTVFNVPLRNASAAPIVVTTSQPNIVTVGGGSSTNTDDHDDHDDDHDEDDHDEKDDD
jgi:SH3-like domain-containing protein